MRKADSAFSWPSWLTRKAPPADLPNVSSTEYLPLHPLAGSDFGEGRRKERVDGDTLGFSLSTLISPTTQRWLLYAIGIIATWKVLAYLYSDPERWDKSWEESLSNSKAIVANKIVNAAGYRWKGSYEQLSGRGGCDYVAWRGIKYGENPIGWKRFRASRPLKRTFDAANENTWMAQNTVNATEWNEGCLRPYWGRTQSGVFEGVEDCLALNVFTPKKRLPDKLFPVMVWIHGGGFYSGHAGDPRYDPRKLICRGVSMNQPFVFVSINYRLGPFGFTASPPEPGKPPTAPHIPTQAPRELDLNVGLKDQLLALHWVRNEIAGFGGDPDKVTLVGHSAGAISVGLHQIYSPPELFRAAFMLSGAPTSFPVPWPHDASARTLHPLPGPAQCPSPVRRPTGPPANDDLVDCLRKKSAAQIMEASNGIMMRTPMNAYFPWLPVVEGEWNGSWLDVRPSDRIVRGTFSKVPVIMGSARDEGTRFTSPEIASQQDILEAVKAAFEFTFGAIETILTPIWEFYPDSPSVGSPYNTGNETYGLSSSYKRAASLIGDLFFQAPRRHFLRETPKDFGEPSWNYLYNEKDQHAEPRIGVAHSAGLDAWFGNSEETDSEMHHLSRHMTSYLINFVANLDPNGPGLRYWPQYGTNRRTLHLSRHNISLIHDDDRLEALRFLNENNPIFAR